MAPDSKQEVILFLPLNSPGHINPSLALADRLSQEYDYKCVFALIEQHSGDNIEKHGHLLIELEDIGGETDKSGRPTSEKSPLVGIEIWSNIIKSQKSGFTSAPIESFKTIMNVIKCDFLPKMQRNFHQYERVVREFKPALIVIDHLFPPPYVLKEENNYPWVRLHSANPYSVLMTKLPNKVKPMSWLGNPLLSKEERTRMRREEPEKWHSLISEWNFQCNNIKPILADAHKSLTDYYRSLGLGHRLTQNSSAPRSEHQGIDSPYLNIYIFPDALDYAEDDDILEYPKRYLQCNSLVRESVPSKSEQDYWLKLLDEKSKGKEACVLFSLGSIASGDKQLVERLVSMLSHDQNRLYIVSKGFANDSIKLDERNMIGANYIPQPFLLQHVDLAIVHGGNNGITECLQNGVPVIVLPMYGDQFDNAQRVLEKNVGKTLSLYNCTREQLLESIDQLLADQELRTRVKTIGKKMRAQNNLARVSEILHTLSQQKKLDDKTLDEFKEKS